MIFHKPVSFLSASLLALCALLPVSIQAKTQEQKPVVVYIDPGHGGYDSGAVGANGELEKDLAMEIAAKTTRILRNINPYVQVVLSRSSDTISWPDNEWQDLEARVAKAKKAKAQYYLSIHLNSNEDTSLAGVQGWMRADDTISHTIYTNIQKNLKSMDWVKDTEEIHTSWYYPLYVVDTQTIPVLLLEAGYISNPAQCKALQDEKVQTRLACVLAAAYSRNIFSHTTFTD